MPHAELKYSTDLDLPAADILATIEAVIQRHDAGSGECKGRAYPAVVFHHSHVLVEISMLPKAHRDAAFVTALRDDLEAAIKAHLPVPCFFSLNLAFSGSHYVTNQHNP